MSDGKPDGPKLGVPVGRAFWISGGCSCIGHIKGVVVVGLVIVGMSDGVVIVGTSDAILGPPVVGESVVGLLVLGESVVGLGLKAAAVKGEPDEGALVDGEVLLGTPVHGPTLHAVESEVAGQACATPMVTAAAATRVREHDPPPHATEQLLQPVQRPTPQSVHAIAKQRVLLDRAGQAEPPPDATSVTERQRCELPKLHRPSQVVHEFHDVTAQSTGHVTVTHALSSVVLEQALPPLVA